MADVDTSSYLKPQPPANPLDTITKIGGVADTLGNLAVGQGMQQAIQPDGSIDSNTLAQFLKQSPAGAMKATQSLDALQKLRQAGYAADQAGVEAYQKRMAIVHNLFTGLASKDNPTMDDVYEIAARAMDPNLNAKQYGITAPVVMNAVSGFKGPDGKPLPPAAMKQKALQMASQAESASEAIAQHSPRMVMTDDGQFVTNQPAGSSINPASVGVQKRIPPTATVATPKGPQYVGEQPPQAPTIRPGPINSGNLLDGVTGVEFGPVTNPQTGAVIGPAGQPMAHPGQPQPRGPALLTPAQRIAQGNMTPTGPMAGLPPGYEHAADINATQAAQGAANLSIAANEVPQTRAILNNLEKDLGDFTSGQGADYARIAKNFANRNLPIPKSWKEAGAVFDEKSLASQEGFNKQAGLLAQAQFQALGGTGTDAKLGSAMSTSPNEYLSSLGNKGIIRLLKGNQDALEVKNKEWLAYKKANGPDSYNDFNAEFNQNFDPRVFQYKYVAPDDRKAFLEAMDPDEQKQFVRDVAYARKNKWVKLPGDQ